MADIKAFAGLRYNLAQAGQLQDLITPPYDVIDGPMQEGFYQRNPYNVIRLEWGKTTAADDDGNNRYTRAAKDFAHWQKEGILQQEAAPALYYYTQTFPVAEKLVTRSGFIATIRAEGYESGKVLPHEETLPKHKLDRLELMRHTYANFSPILGLFAQEKRTIDQALAAAAQRPADLDATDDLGVRHQVWVVKEEAVIRQVEKEMADRKVYIADGHHRYETASLFAQECAEQGRKNCDYLMLDLINLYDPGLLVFPTHRLVKSLGALTPAELLTRVAAAGFTVLQIKGDNQEKALAALLHRMGQDGHQTPSFGLCFAGQLYLLQLPNKEKAVAGIKPEKSAAYRSLDVTILHSLILENILGIGDQELAAEGFVGYTRDQKAAYSLVEQGEWACSFLMNSTTVQQLLAVAEAGDKMPQKSTYFYPKVIAGLVIHKLGE